MPHIDDVVKNKSKKFEKKAYRPWDDMLIKNENINSIDDGINGDLIKKTSLVNETKEDDIGKILRGLYGVQKNILQYFVKNIISKDDIFVYTKQIAIQDLLELIKAPVSSIKVSIQRLKKIELLDHHEYKPGRGGYASYKIKLEKYKLFESYFK